MLDFLFAFFIVVHVVKNSEVHVSVSVTPFCTCLGDNFGQVARYASERFSYIGQQTRPSIYCPCQCPRRLEILTVCGCNYKDSNFYSATCI